MPKSVLLLLCVFGDTAFGQTSSSLAERIHHIMNRAEFRHSRFGMEFYSLDTNQPVFSMNADQFFVPGSTTKLLTEGAALDLLGPDFRFHTRVYRTGPVAQDGALKGDLILVAGGDPNLSNRIRSDGTLAFENIDHAYDGVPGTRAVSGDPLAVLRRLAAQVADQGIRRVDGRVLVDATLFGEGEKELGTGVSISSIVVNDNLVDVLVQAGGTIGARALLHVSPETAYVRFVNQTKTIGAGGKETVRWASDVTNYDGTHTVIVKGDVPEHTPAKLHAYRVSEPSRFAQVAFVETLEEKGVSADYLPRAQPPDFVSSAAFYTPEHQVAEHVSPPLTEEIRVTLKVSQNLHASMMPYILGAILGHKKEDIDQGGFELERGFLERAKLDLSSASQADGAGGAAFYTPDFMVHFLAHMAKHKAFDDYYKALPVLGKDGTLADIQAASPAAGSVHAKTGTFANYNSLGKNLMVLGKGLAGYLKTKDGRNLAFAIYVNFVPVNIEKGSHELGDVLGEIAAAAYEAAP